MVSSTSLHCYDFYVRISMKGAMAETTVSPESPKQRKLKSWPWPYNQSAYLAHLYVPDIYVYNDDPLKLGPNLVKMESSSSTALKYLNHLYCRQRRL